MWMRNHHNAILAMARSWLGRPCDSRTIRGWNHSKIWSEALIYSKARRSCEMDLTVLCDVFSCLVLFSSTWTGKYSFFKNQVHNHTLAPSILVSKEFRSQTNPLGFLRDGLPVFSFLWSESGSVHGSDFWRRKTSSPLSQDPCLPVLHRRNLIIPTNTHQFLCLLRYDEGRIFSFTHSCSERSQVSQ